VIDEWMGMERWRNGTDRGKLKCWDRNRSQCHRAHHKSDIPGPRRVRSASNRLSHDSIQHSSLWER